MITSRKVLLATVLVSVAFVSALPIAINLKYKKLDFINADKIRYDYYKLDPFTVVSAKYLKNLVIVTSDSSRLEVAQELRNSIKITNTSDTLSIIYDNDPNQDSSKVILYLPKTGKIIALESIIELRGGVNDIPPPPSYTFDLRRSHLSIPTFAYHQFFNQLYISGSDSSTLKILEHNHIWELHLINLQNSFIDSSVELRSIKTSFEGKAAVNMSSDEDTIEIKSTR